MTVTLVLILLIALNALYVAAEFAAVSARKPRVSSLAGEGNKLARTLLPILEDGKRLDTYIAACQVGITLSSLIVGFYGQASLAPVLAPLFSRFGNLQAAAAQTTAVIIALVFLTSLQVIFGELLPKSVAIRYPERLATATVLPMRLSLLVLRPFIYVLNGSALWLMQRLGLSKVGEHHVHSPEELESLFRESARGGLIDAGEREMLENVLRFETRLARQIMIPRNRMVALDLGLTAGQGLAAVIETPHTRFPVFEADRDHIVGMVHLRELFTLARERSDANLRDIVRALPLFPESITVNHLWARLREQNAYMAVLFDEYGGTVGLVTLEDIVEEVVGEVQDEFDRETEKFRERLGRALVRGDVLVSRLNDKLLMNLDETQADTVGGYMQASLGRIPAVGDTVDAGGSLLRVDAMDGNSVSMVSLELAQDQRENPADPSSETVAEDSE